MPERLLAAACIALLAIALGSPALASECGTAPPSSRSPRTEGFDLSWPHSASKLLIGLKRRPVSLQGVGQLLGPVLARIHAEIVDYFPRTGIVVIELGTSGDHALTKAADLIATQASQIVEYVEPNRCVYVEPHFSTAISSADECEDPWSLDKIDAQTAWNQPRGSNKVVVAVIDTGIQVDHDEVKDQLWDNSCEQDNDRDDACSDERSNQKSDDLHGWNFVDKNDEIDDTDGHGTEVSSVIGASHTRGSCAVGLNQDVSLMVLKALEGQNGYVDYLVAAIDYAVAEGASVINASWSTDKDPSLLRALEDARAKEIIVVTAAGKQGAATDLDGNPSYPCSYRDQKNLICVTGTTKTDQREASSCFGDETVHLGAPGDAICTASKGGTCALRGGASLAAPHVTGVVALMRAKCGCDPADDIIKRIRESVHSALTTETRWKGRLDAGAALSAPCSTPCPPP